MSPLKKLHYSNKFNKPVLFLLRDKVWNHLITYPTPINLTYAWNFGSLSIVCLGIQVLTGVFLTMYYCPSAALAFLSVENIMRDVNSGWFVRYTHANGASFFFIVVYFHIARSLFYRSYENKVGLWWSGIIIFFLMMATAFMGYVLPWGQMSFWGTTVITSLFSAVPVFGPTIVTWIWGDLAISEITLNRFFSLHYLFGFLVVGAVVLHIVLLHKGGSNSPLNTNESPKLNKLNFYPFFVVKDVFGLFIFGAIFSTVIFFYPNIMGHPDNYIEANPLVTPAHIVPEWYFLPFYATLRSIPGKLQGILYMVIVIVSLGFLPVIDRTKLSDVITRPLFVYFYWIWVFSFFFLGWLGAKPLETPYLELHQPVVFFYFSFYSSFFFLFKRLEQTLLKKF